MILDGEHRPAAVRRARHPASDDGRAVRAGRHGHRLRHRHADRHDGRHGGDSAHQGERAAYSASRTTPPSPTASAIPTARQVLTAASSSRATARAKGDSGSGAFEQGNFNNGKWVAFGVLSRGGVSTDGTTCEQPIYTRFDAWSSLIVGAAQQAAAKAQPRAMPTRLPTWAGGTAERQDAGSVVTGASSGGRGFVGQGGQAAAASNAAGGLRLQHVASRAAWRRERLRRRCSCGAWRGRLQLRNDLCFPGAVRRRARRLQRRPRRARTGRPGIARLRFGARRGRRKRAPTPPA